jgi:uncharacterized protein (DUF433 family)
MSQQNPDRPPPPTDPVVVSDPEILGGTPVFAGSRVPIDMVLASVDKGISMDRIVAAYPFITEVHIAAAREYRCPRTPEQIVEDKVLEEQLTAALIQVLTDAQRKH